MADLKEKIVIIDAIKVVMAGLTPDEQFEILDTMIEDYPEQMLASALAGMQKLAGMGF